MSENKIVVTKNQGWAVEEEDTEGVYKAPVSGESFVQTLAEGAEMSRSKELIERNIFTASVGKVAPRTGQFQVAGTLPVEARASLQQGDAPEFDLLLLSALGAKRAIDTPVVSDDEEHTDKKIFIQDADQLFQVGDIVLIQEPGAFHVSPIVAVSEDAIDLLVAAKEPFSPEVTISRSTIYTVADSGHPSFSVSRYLEGSVVQKAMGAKVNSMALEGFSTGQLPSFSFGFEGLNFDSEVLVGEPPKPIYNTQLPPIILGAAAYMDGAVVDVNEITLSLENALGFQTSVNEENGRKSSRVTERTISGTLNPYMRSDSMATFEKFKDNTPFSLFAYCKLPTATRGEFGGVVAVYLPNCLITELGESDQDGLLQDSISFSANRGDGTQNEIFVAFI